MHSIQHIVRDQIARSQPDYSYSGYMTGLVSNCVKFCPFLAKLSSGTLRVVWTVACLDKKPLVSSNVNCVARIKSLSEKV